ncbi:hypothetical protein C8J57DRAFT_952801, partial [Mycena rebaudengoi]
MVNRRISRDVKIAALNLYEHGHLSVKEILACVGFSRRTFYRILNLRCTTGNVVKERTAHSGQHRILHYNDIDYLLRLVRHQPDWFLSELLSLLRHNRFISVHYTTIHRELQRAGMSTKELTVIAAERSEPCRWDFVHTVSPYPAHYLGFLDETSKNDKTPARRLGLDGMMACKVVEGSMKCEQYLEFLEYQVV